MGYYIVNINYKYQQKYYVKPTIPLPLHRGQVTREALSARVSGAFGLAPKGNSSGIFPFPSQTGHFDTTDKPAIISSMFSSGYLIFSDITTLKPR